MATQAHHFELTARTFGLRVNLFDDDASARRWLKTCP
jgi:hypothetical protein